MFEVRMVIFENFDKGYTRDHDRNQEGECG